MPRHCTICHHPQLREITADLMARKSYRTIQSRYSVSKSALDRHIGNHVSLALRKLAEAETMSVSDAAGIAQPVLAEMRKLNARAMRILGDAEAAQDHAIALHAIRECRRNLELIAKLTGELDPRMAGEGAGGPLHVTIQYVDKQLAVSAAPPPQLERGGEHVLPR